ncbi:MAG: amidohydrolase [Clostridia bacterium]|nr:amidohydrolase [Clostridia bacterium]
MLIITNANVKTMAGKDIKNCSILIDDNGKIAEVGKKIDVPEDAEVIDAEGRLVTPGCIDGHCHVGLWNEIYAVNDDHNEKGDPITPQMRGIDGINPVDEAFEAALQRGVTTACTGPGSVNVIGGTFAVIKLSGNNIDKMVVKNPAAMKCAFGENPKKNYSEKGKSPVTRMAIAALLRETLTKAKKYAEEDAMGKPHAFDMKLEAMIPVMRKEIPLKAHAHQADDILTAIRIAKEFDVDMTIDHCTDGVLITEELLEAGYPLMLGPLITGTHKVECKNKSLETPAKLKKAGLSFCIVTDSPVVPLEYLPMCAGLAVRDGLDVDDAWRAITVEPAKILGVADRIGSIEKGKDADIVIWDKDPLMTVGAVSYRTIVDGKVVYAM